MFRFGVKSAILGTAIYYTIDKGVWKDSNTTALIYEELEKGASPYVGELKKQIPYEFPPMPSNDRVSYLFKHYWNSGVKITFKFLVDLPIHVSNGANQAYNMISSALENVDKSTAKIEEKAK